jgi:cell wall-associated NlpC family hydrolase
MHIPIFCRALFPALVLVLVLALHAAPATADEAPASVSEAGASLPLAGDAATLGVIERALQLVGVRYKRGGNTPETGFDCSGFVDHVFREATGLVLPRRSRDLGKVGAAVDKDELKPGDLVLFRTVRNAVSHIGIYVGDHLFIHAPRQGEKVGLADLRERYWVKRYSGARRVEGN